jgi:uncharacterized protein (UPF0332 family)
MKAEAADYLAKARQCLEGARTIADVSLHHVAGREAYLAAFHAAEAYNFERTGKTVKIHRSLRATFSRLANDEPSIPRECLRLLAEGYEIKRLWRRAGGSPHYGGRGNIGDRSRCELYRDNYPIAVVRLRRFPKPLKLPPHHQHQRDRQQRCGGEP